MKNNQQFKALVMEKVEQGRYRQQIKRRQTIAAVTSLCVTLVLSAGIYGAWRLLPAPSETDDIVSAPTISSQQNGSDLPSAQTQAQPSDPPPEDDSTPFSSTGESVANDSTSSPSQSDGTATDSSDAEPDSSDITPDSSDAAPDSSPNDAEAHGTYSSTAIPTFDDYSPFPAYPIRVINVSEHMEAQLQSIGGIISDAEQVETLIQWIQDFQKNGTAHTAVQGDLLFALSFSDGSVIDVYDEFIFIHRLTYHRLYSITEQDLNHLITMMKPQ